MSIESNNPTNSRSEKKSVFVNAWTREAYRDESILELKKPLENILESLKDDIKNARIVALIGDDTSGRIPTLILRGVLSEIYKSNNEKTPTTLFINGPGGGRPEDPFKDESRIVEITEYLKRRISSGELALHPEKKTLLVTETIKSGNSLKPVVEACRRLGVAIEVVAIGIENEKSISQVQNELNVPVYVGMDGTPKIYNKPAYSGVTKPRPDPSTMFERTISTPPDTGLFANPYIKSVPKDDKERTQDLVNAVRDQANMLSKELVEEFVSKAK